jgi:hypothetical protein
LTPTRWRRAKTRAEPSKQAAEYAVNADRWCGESFTTDRQPMYAPLKTPGPAKPRRARANVMPMSRESETEVPVNRNESMAKPTKLMTDDATNVRRAPKRSTTSPHSPAAASAVKKVIDDARLTRLSCVSHSFSMSL